MDFVCFQVCRLRVCIYGTFTVFRQINRHFFLSVRSGISRRIARNHGCIGCRQDDFTKRADISHNTRGVRDRSNGRQRSKNITGRSHLEDGLRAAGRFIYRHIDGDGAPNVSGDGANGSSHISSPENQAGQ